MSGYCAYKFPQISTRLLKDASVFTSRFPPIIVFCTTDKEAFNDISLLGSNPENPSSIAPDTADNGIELSGY